MVYFLQILLILVMISGGWLARRRGWLSAVGTRELSKVLLTLIYPLLVGASVLRLPAARLLQLWYMPALAIALAVLGLAVGGLALALLPPLAPERRRAFLFQCTVNNYIFLPLPLVLYAFGADGVSLLVLAAFGYEIALWTLGRFLFTGREPLARRLKNVLGPPFVALVISVALVFLRDGFAWQAILPAAIFSIASHLHSLFLFGAGTFGQATVGVSMLVAGSRIAVLHPHTLRLPAAWAATGLRLLVIPALYILLLHFLPLPDLARHVLTVVGVMPAAVASVIFSEQFGGDGEFIASVLLLSHLGALITVPLILALAL